MPREARLKDRYAALYPCLRPGAWQPGAVVVDRLLACLMDRASSGGAVRLGRLLDDAHFEFRGESRRKETCCTRVGEW